MGSSRIASNLAKTGKTASKSYKIASGIARATSLVSNTASLGINARDFGNVAGKFCGKYFIEGEEFSLETVGEIRIVVLSAAACITSAKGMMSDASALDDLRKMNKQERNLRQLDRHERHAQRGQERLGRHSKSGSNTNIYYHSCADEVVDIIADTGFRTDLSNEVAAFHNNRYGRGVYLADSPATALAERPGGTILKVSGNPGKNLDITSRGVIGGDDYTMTHAIARGARKHGFDSITFMSAKNPDGVNTVIFNPANVRVEEILR